MRAHHMIADSREPLEQAEALALVTDLLAATETKNAPLEDGSHPREHHAVGAARDYIHEHWCEDFTLAELGASVGLSPFYLCRLFSQQIGMPPSAYRRSVRVEAARRLLARGEPAIRVAAACGFHDQAHLTRHFKRATGLRPPATPEGKEAAVG